ncbi:MAG: hypothetical protein H0X26_08255 [Alphaproteobacteria bacterium]|nr:hypothetical protein [Alphaproteobacteria bacterium]
MEEIIIDATEQQIERLKKGQKAFYSGKKKCHTNKTEIRITPSGRIIHVSKQNQEPFMILLFIKRKPQFPKI